MRKLLEVYEIKTGNLIVKRYKEVYKIPPCKYVIEDSINNLNIVSKEDAIRFMLKYFDGLELVETKKLSEESFKPITVISLKLKK